MSRPGAFLPARRLMAAVLGVALADYQSCAGARTAGSQRRMAALEAWFASDETSWPFSFANICAALELDPVSVRTAVRVSWGSAHLRSRPGFLGRG